MSKKVALIIMDGWGEGRKDDSNAIFKANTPFVDSLYENYPNTTLKTSGLDVGLPDGQMGNSEVGHLNIGAGRVVYQDLVKINKACEDRSLLNNKVFTEAIAYAKENNVKVHLMGLVSDGGVHSSQEHLHHIIDLLDENEVNNVFVHAFMDGRDCDPNSGIGFINKLDHHCENKTAAIASIIGRYYAMDRDNRWERVKLAYDLLTKAEGEANNDPVDAIQKSYSAGVTDEFIKPVSVNSGGIIEENDVVLCFNFRTDRCREITVALTQKTMHEHNMFTIPLHYITMTRYDDKFECVRVLFEKDNLKNTLGEVLEANDKTQVRIAETEKYPHVTFFFSGGRETEFKGETRIMASSPKVATYDMQPEMSANEVTSKICPVLEKGETDFICLNFANTDMVGHTGVFEAAMQAAETVDACVKNVVEAGLKSGYSFLITADHGNADYMINDDGSPNTAHTTNLVPLFLIDNDYKSIKEGKLGDLAPTVLKMMGIEIPSEMTGEILI